MVDLLENLRSLYAERRLDEAWVAYSAHPDLASPEWHWLGSLVAMRQQEWFSARGAIERALPLPAPEELCIKIRFQHGMVTRAIGDFGLAISEFDWCLERMESHPDIKAVARGPALYNRALALGSTSDLTGSLRTYAAAADEFRREGMQEHLRMCLQNLSWVACDLGQVERAACALDEAATLCTTEEARWHQRLQLTRLTYARGARTEALRLCEWIESAGKDVPTEVLCLVSCVTTDVALDLGLVDLAGLTVNLAFDRALKAPCESRCMSVVSRVRRRYNASRTNLPSTGA